MTSRDFVYWLQGFFEISGTDKVSPEQVKVIRNHLNMVFKHEIDPSHGDEKHQEALSKLHVGKHSQRKRKENLSDDSGYRKPPRAMC